LRNRSVIRVGHVIVGLNVGGAESMFKRLTKSNPAFDTKFMQPCVSKLLMRSEVPEILWGAVEFPILEACVRQGRHSAGTCYAVATLAIER
jgi:hypothetical protein